MVDRSIKNYINHPQTICTHPEIGVWIFQAITEEFGDKAPPRQMCDEGRTGGRTDKVSYRVASTRLKI